MIQHAKIKGYKINEEGTWMKILVPNIDLSKEIVNKQISNLELRMDDNRTISIIQRKKAYALLGEISEYSGYPPEVAKEIMKWRYMALTGNDNISLSNCTMTEAREFISTIIDYCIEEGVHTKDNLLHHAEDIDRFLWKCLETRTCCICGRKNSDRHHTTGYRVGMGNNRNKIDNTGRKMICLCRTHHNEIHQDELKFMDKYHVYGIEYEEEL